MSHTPLDITRLVAHRGWHNRYPENTLPAVRAAIDAGARNIEIDLQLSADGVPFLFHDRSLRRLCRRKGSVHDYPAAQLRTFTVSEAKRLGSAEHDGPMCGLAEIATLLARYPDITLYAELKEYSLKAFSREDFFTAVDAVLHPLRERVVMISFDLPLLALARERGWARLSPVLRRWRQLNSTELRALEPESVFCDFQLVPPEADLHALPQRLILYEIGSLEETLHWLRRGAHRVETFCIGEVLQADSEARRRAI